MPVKLRCFSVLIFVASMVVASPTVMARTDVPSRLVAVDSTQATPDRAQPASGPASALSLEERIERIEERLSLALSLKDERIQSISERSENAYKLLQYIGILAAALLAFFSIRDVVLRRREGERQRGIDEMVKSTMEAQKTAAKQQADFGALLVKQMDPSQQFAAVQNVNNVIEVVSQTLRFRLEQEQSVANALKEIGHIKEEREHVKKQRLDQARAIHDHFKNMSRMQFAALTDEQYKRGIRLQALVNDLDEFLEGRDIEDLGDLLYVCGVVAYYDNDVIEAKTYLDRAADQRASDHEGELKTNNRYRNRFAFTHYFRALIQKNWGDLPEAQYEIELSTKLLTDKASEFLTPVTRAEILSYTEGLEEHCRTELQGLVQSIDGLEVSLKNKDEGLNPNQRRLRNRMLILWGNTHFQQKAFEKARTQYGKAIEFDPDDYYALASAAQCAEALGDHDAAQALSRRGVDAIERSGDFRRKRERITRAVIAVVAANLAAGCGDADRREQYAREARELLSGNLAVDGMSPKFFSPATKRLVRATELLKELDS